MSTLRLVREVARVATLLEPKRRKLYDFVYDGWRPVSRDQAADAVGISRAMAAFHLDRLVEAGLLRAEYRRLAPGRAGQGTGRPSKLYRRSRSRLTLALPPRDFELLAQLLAKALDQSSGTATPRQLGTEVGHALGVRARNKLSVRPSPARLTACVTEAMAEVGFEPVPAPHGVPGDVRARNCPFDPLSGQLPDVVCPAALGIVAGVVDGARARHLHVSRDPRPGLCCVVLHTTVGGSSR